MIRQARDHQGKGTVHDAREGHAQRGVQGDPRRQGTVGLVSMHPSKELDTIAIDVKELPAQSENQHVETAGPLPKSSAHLDSPHLPSRTIMSHKHVTFDGEDRDNMPRRSRGHKRPKLEPDYGHWKGRVSITRATSAPPWRTSSPSSMTPAFPPIIYMSTITVSLRAYQNQPQQHHATAKT